MYRDLCAASLAASMCLPAFAGVPDLSNDLAPLDAALRQPLAEAGRAASDADGNFVVDVLVLYTPLVEARGVGGMPLRPYAAHLIARANEYFEKSRMPVRYRLAGVHRTGATSDARSYGENHADLAASGEVRELRNRAGADLVALLRTNDASNSCGLGSLFNGGEQTDPPANVDPERDAFAIVGAAPSDAGISCIDVEHTFAHELGHCLGGGHQNPAFSGVHVRDEGNVYVGAYWKPYAHGSYCGLASSGARNNTIMMGGVGFANGPYVQGGDLRGDYFSNADLVVDGAPCGVYVAGLTEAEADNARAISEAAPYVAAYRSAADGKSGGGSGVLAGGVPVVTLLALGLALLARTSARPRRS